MSKEFSIEDKLKSVIELQKIDSKIDELNALKGELPQLVKDLDDQIAGYNTRLARITTEIEEIEQNIMMRRESKKETKKRIEKYEEQSNDIKNKREFDALNSEIESAELEITHTDKLIREENGKLTELKERGSDLEDRIEELESKKEEKEAELEKIMTKTAEEEGKLEKQVANKSKAVEERILKAYSNLRTNFKNGMAVVPIEREACGGCYNQVPPQKQAEIGQHKKIIACEHCGRILVDPELFESVTVKN